MDLFDSAYFSASDGQRIALYAAKEPSAIDGSEKPALLVLHCNGISFASYTPLARALASHFWVFGMDFRGGGQSLPLTGEVSFPRLASDAAEVRGQEPSRRP